MSDLLTHYCHGYLAEPMIEACRRRGLFQLLHVSEFRERQWLIGELRANAGYFNVALEVLESWGWLEKNGDDAYRLTGNAVVRREPGLTDLYATEPELWMTQDSLAHRLKEKIEQVCLQPDAGQSALADPAWGAIMVPLIVSLQSLKAKDVCAELNRSAMPLCQTVIQLFLRQQWLAEDGTRLTASGRALLESDVFKSVASWRPLLNVIDELLFGDHVRAFQQSCDRDAFSLRKYLLGKNIAAGTIAGDLQREIVAIFNSQPPEKQPQAIVDVNCGNGALLADLWEAIRSLTLRGRLAEMPLRLVGVDGSQRSPEDTSAILAGLQYQTVLVEGDQPEELGAALAQAGLTRGKEVLQLRLFADHLLTAAPIHPMDQTLRVLADDQPSSYVDQHGLPLDALTVLSLWQRHFRALSKSLHGSRLLMIEAHAAPSRPAVAQSDESELFHCDWIHRFAHEYLISAEAFIVLAAGAGLLNEGCVKRYPATSDSCRISFHNFEKRDYIIRHATEADLDRLCQLEEICWQHTRTSREQICARLRDYPQGQFVLEKEGKVLGVIYSQRIAGVDGLMTCNAEQVHRLHQPSGPLVQLLAVNVDPQTQNAGYGDQLLEFMLQRCSLMPDVTRVVGVTLCKSFNSAGAQSFEQYIRRQGGDQDPVLAFHQAHGAEVVQPVAGYRPQDQANLGNGVLVAYDLLNRIPRYRRNAVEGDSASPAVSLTAVADSRQIGSFVRSEAARLLGVADGDCDLDRPLMEMGLDSADLLKLQQQLEEKVGLRLGAAFFFEHNNLRKVIDYLTAKTSTAPPPEKPVTRDIVAQLPVNTVTPAKGSQPDKKADKNNAVSADIAIIGISCKLPGGIDTPGQLWQALVSQKCMIGAFPATRGDWPADADRPAINQGGFVVDADAFDAPFFRISRAEAEITDPQQRMLLELAWACMEDAGILPETLKGSNTGVFVGASNCDYSRLIQEAGLEVEAHHGIGSSLAVLANRLSYFFDLSGPSLLIDTACSSSLVALHTAIQSLRSGECAAALVGGANLICHPDLSIAYHKAGMLAPDGRCKVFDAKADGYVRSEGAVMLLIKPLSAAMAAGDRIHAVIQGSAVNHGGLAAGLTVPNPQKQSELLVAAWQDAGIAAHDLTYIEAHGTGTSLGDPIEIQGIQSAWSRLASKEPARPCAIGSVKSNLGHLESAAGITGLLRTVLSLRHRQIPASVNFERLNPGIRLQDTPFYIQDQLRDWNAESPRLAAVSSFGSGGANAHVVVREHLCDVRSAGPGGDHLFVLSAAAHDRLRIYAMRVIGWIEKESSGVEFGDAIYTWQVGRTTMKHRLAIKVKNEAELAGRLRQWLAGNENISDLWSGQAGQGDSSAHQVWQTTSGRLLIDQALLERDLAQIAVLWTSGIEIDWAKCHQAVPSAEIKPRLVSLPTYPFAKERYWIDTLAGKNGASRGRLQPGAMTAVLHPLVHSNISDLDRQRYSSTFTGEEFFLADHQIETEGRGRQKVLPGVACLEMARVAVEQASPARPEPTTLELRNVVWAQQIVVTQSRQITIGLFDDDNGDIDFEICSQDGDSEIVHCQGSAARSSQAMPARLDIGQLRAQTDRRSFVPNTLYPAFARMGLHYGPAHQGITALRMGEKQVLAHLRLPLVVETGHDDFGLHPSLMDSAVQASLGLIVDPEYPPEKPSLPFALESLRIVAACAPEMIAWVHYSPGSQPTDKVVKLDIDLCDEQGNVCVQMRGFSSRVSGVGAASTAVSENLLAAPVWQIAGAEAITDSGGFEYAEHHVILCELPGIGVEPWNSLLPGSRCLSLPMRDQKNIAQRYSEHALALFTCIQEILKSGPQGKVLVQVVVADHQEQALLAGLSGLLKSAALEAPHLAGQLILVPADMPVGELVQRLREERTVRPDALVRYENGTRRIFAWQEIVAAPENPPIAFKDEGVYLITGGLGGLGTLFAREILGQTSKSKVVLTGRSALNAENRARIDALSAQAGRVSYRQVDLTNLQQVRELMAAIEEEYGKLNGILHSAGMIADSFLLKKSADSFLQVLEPKVTGTLNLDQACQDADLDFFVLFSSLAGALGNVGQADYAAANGFMDWFAAHRNTLVAAKQRRGSTRSINWPLWQAGGMNIDPSIRELQQRATGMQPLRTAAGLLAFYRSLALPHDQILVMEGDAARMLRILFPAASVETEGSSLPAAVIVPEVPMDSDGLRSKTLDYLCRQLSEVLKVPAHTIDPKTGFDHYGIDSIMAMKLTNQLEKTFGSLSKTLFFEHQNIPELTRYFVQFHSAQLVTLFAASKNGNHSVSASETQPEERPRARTPRESGRRFRRQGDAAPAPAANAEPIAIIGLSGRYPEAVNVDAYWQNLSQGKDSIVEVPADRWDWREYFTDDRTKSGHHYSKWGGFIAGVDEFDPLFFNIAPREAKYIDPQERLFLQHAWMAVEDAGYTRASLQVPSGQDLAGQVGVYVGVMYSEYQLLSGQADAQDLRMGFAGNLASIANRVSYALNLHGPSMTLDTMCSSSLTAIHVACKDLEQGRTSLAIAGGVNVSIHPNKYRMLSVGQFISGDGHCQSFGEGGDGYIPGEGVGAVVLKRLSEAKRDGDHIYGIIRGSALTHGGRTNGYTVPNPQAQAGAIGRALAESRVDPRHISYIEAHGTGTKLGDPIEIAALSKAFRQYTQDNEFCRLGSVKSNIGHCEAAAGVAGLTKVLLQMQHRQIVPSLHSARLNPHIDFPGSPFVVNQSLRSWDPPVVDGRTLPRIAGISSFGAGGSNAHVIVEEHPASVQPSPAFSNVAIVLSARTPEQLQQKALDLLQFVSARLSTLDLVSVAYTLQVGREAMEERLGLVVNSADQLTEKLRAYVEGRQGLEDVFRGAVKRNKEALSLFSKDAELQQTIDKWMGSGTKLSRLLDLWVKGLDLDWSRLYGEVKPRRMPLPVYPFARERYWIDIKTDRQPAARKAAAAALHPLLHRNTSDLNEQRYTSAFTADEFFIADYQVLTDAGAPKSILPAVALLEMARAAVEQVRPEESESAIVELHNIVWAQPAVVTQNRQINIALSANKGGQVDYEIYSQESGQEIIHGQGCALRSREPAPARLDIEQLRKQMTQGTLEPNAVYAACARKGFAYGPSFKAVTSIDQGRGQLLAHLRLPAQLTDTSRDYQLHPSLTEGALQACVAVLDRSSENSGCSPLLLAIESVRVLAPCPGEMVAWVRYASGSQAEDEIPALDIELSDERGNICVQLREVRWRQTARDTAKPAADLIVQPEIDPEALLAAPAFTGTGAPALPAPKEIAFLAVEKANPRLPERKKPAGISLASPGAMAAEVSVKAGMRKSTLGKPLVRLSDPAHGVRLNGNLAASVSAVRLSDYGSGIFSIQITESSTGDMAESAIGHLLQALGRVRQDASAKVLMLIGLERCFPRGGRQWHNDAVERGLYHALVSFPCPVIAVVHSDALGAGFLAAAVCDFMVCNEDAAYGYTDPQTHFYPTAAEANLFSERFGDVQARDFLYVSLTATGRQLRMKGWTCPIVPAERVEAHAQQLALELAAKSQPALRLLKQHLTRHLCELVKTLAPVEIALPIRENPRGTDAEAILSSTGNIELTAAEEDVLVIRLRAADGKADVKDLLTNLGAVFAGVQQNGRYKSVVLFSEHSGFLPEIEPAVAGEVVSAFQRLIVESPIPVVAGLTGNARDHAWIIGTMCDVCVCSRTGIYSADLSRQSPGVQRTAAALWMHRFGGYAGRELLLTGGEYSGGDLCRRVGTLLVAESDQVQSAALEVARNWAKLSRVALAEWKGQTAAALRDKILSLPAADEDQSPDHPSAVPVPIALKSAVVTATAHPEGIVVVKMEDRQAKNMFSDALLDGVTEAFTHIKDTPGYKVVVLTGYDSYFSSGGTKENLLAVQEGRAKFTDFKIFQLPLECPLPVIAAMQGHGIGAGWSMGMFADIALLSEESRYVSPYMNLGFTPGAGATWSLTDKIGNDLARESLLTGRQYTGNELKDRGLRLAVLPRAEVYTAAMGLAGQIARSSRSRLMNLKQQWSREVQQTLEETYRLELAMHEKTFVGQSDTLAQIQKKFDQKVETPAPKPRQAPAAPANRAAESDALSALTAGLKSLLAAELQMRESDVDENVEFVDLGLDSISGVTWIRRINEKYHMSIEAARVYSYPTLAQMSGYVREEAEKLGTLLTQDAPSPAEKPAAPENPPSAPRRFSAGPAEEKLISRRRTGPRFAGASVAPTSQPIAVIGMAGQFPQAGNVEEFWQNIAQGRNCITQVPPKRWDVQAHYQSGEIVAGRTVSQWLGALEEYDLFDPLFFNISPTEAESMDPQQRLFLQACWHSIEHAGYDARALSGSKCGVFVGCTGNDYHQLSRRNLLSAQGFTGGATSILAARISYFLNLQGPCLSIDTACSSSLVAIAHACDSLASGVSDLALAGGVYVTAGPELHIKTSQAGMLSPTGRCFTFDQRADGIVTGEAVGVVMLKRLADAERDHDIICGVIQGWGVNQDGRTNGITAPNAKSQTRLEQDVYDKFRIDPGQIQLIEAHGTGTKLGDPIEVEALKQSFKKYTEREAYCALGSVKSNIGHCLTAAGVAGFIKLILALKHKQLPPTINFERLNEHISLKSSPFYVSDRLQPWELKGAEVRQAAISSFGFSGTNAHIVVGEYIAPAQLKPPVARIAPGAKIIIPLSARKPEQLKQRARDLRDFIRPESPELDLTEIAYTLQTGREAMEERIGFLVSSVEQLAEKLDAYVSGSTEIPDFHQGQTQQARESVSFIGQDDELKETIVDKWIAQGRLSRLLDLWVKGIDLDWNKLWGDARPRRVNLPVYPFAKERYWIDEEKTDVLARRGAVAAALHPLLHRNDSDLTEQRYSSVFTGEEFFLTDHRVQTDVHSLKKVLPGVAYLEMARAAIEQASPIRLKSSILELRNTVWVKPVIVADRTQISIALHANDDETVAFEIYSLRDEERVIHCHGEAVFNPFRTPMKRDIDMLREQMGNDALGREAVYSMFSGMGLSYGPGHRGIAAILAGDNQLLAELDLPAVQAGQNEYVLHPGLMDSAVQSSIGLIADLNSAPARPFVLFALESVRIMSACVSRMYAWVRHSETSRPGHKSVQLDIDLCDEQGNVCVQMQGLTSRLLQNEVESISDNTVSVRTGERADATEDLYAFDSLFYEQVIAKLLNHEVSVDEAVELG